MSDCVHKLQFCMLNCFATCWISGGLLFLIIGCTLIGSGDIQPGPAIGIIATSMAPLLTGCCMCFCIYRSKCQHGIPKSVGSIIDTTERVSEQQTSTSIDMSQQAQIEVLFCLLKILQK